MALAYAAAGLLDRRKLRVFSEVALLIAGLVFAAAIALVGQSYHLSGEFADAILLWLIGIFAAAVLTASPAMTVLGLVGGGFWTWTVTFDLGAAPHWAGLLPVLVGGAIATVVGWRSLRVLAVLALIFWIALAIGSCGDRYDWSFVGGMALGVAVALVLFALGALLTTIGSGRIAALGNDMLWPALASVLVVAGVEQAASHASTGEQTLTTLTVVAVAVAAAFAVVAFMRKGLAAVDIGAVALVGVGALLFALNVPAEELWARLAGGAILIVAALWAINLGQTGAVAAAKTTGLVALGLEIIYLYVVTFGTLMDTAVAFLLGGVLFIVLAWGLYRLDRHLAGRAATRPMPTEATP